MQSGFVIGDGAVSTGPRLHLVDSDPKRFLSRSRARSARRGEGLEGQFCPNAESKWLVERTPHTDSGSIEHMGVDHRGSDVFMAQQFLHGANIVAVFEEMRCEGMSERMTACRFA